MIQLPNEPKVIDKPSPLKAIFEIGPLYPGYGVTIGNSIRRVLISSMEGAAVTSFKVKGVNHEFSAIPGILEDVVQLILNLKKVRFRVFQDEPVTLTLKANGEGIVTAADIKTSSDTAEVINPDQHIATITDKKGELEMELRVEKGVGYVPADQREKTKLGVGVIAIDGIFTPIRNVNFQVENIRVDQRTDYNKVILDIETDGSITPEDALQKASQVLIEHFNIINRIEVPELELAKPAKKSAAKKTKKSE